MSPRSAAPLGSSAALIPVMLARLPQHCYSELPSSLWVSVCIPQLLQCCSVPAIGDLAAAPESSSWDGGCSLLPAGPGEAGQRRHHQQPPHRADPHQARRGQPQQGVQNYGYSYHCILSLFSSYLIFRFRCWGLHRHVWQGYEWSQAKVYWWEQTHRLKLLPALNYKVRHLLSMN